MNGKQEGPHSEVDSALASLIELITVRSVDPGIPENNLESESYLVLHKSLVEIRGVIMATASGDLSYPITMKGYLPGTLKALQASLRHLTWQTQAIAGGDFSQRVDFMGEFSTSFNAMVVQLEESVQKLRNSEQVLWLAAHTDMLTGMKNRSWFFELFEESINLQYGSESGLAVIMFDVDRFKNLNDTLGHAAGDEGLRSVGRALSTLGLRDVDYWGRLGGEEFAIVLPFSDVASALTVAERLRLAIEKARIVYAGIEFGLTVSIGVSMRIEGDSTGTLLGRADSAMYRAKESGRNRVCS